MRKLRRLLLLALLVAIVPTAVALAGERSTLQRQSSVATVTATDVTDLPSVDRELRLLVNSTQPLDSVVVDPGGKAIPGARIHVHRDDWNCETRRDRWQCSGPVLQPGQKAYFSWQGPRSWDLPPTIKLQLEYNGHTYFKDKISVGHQQGIQVKNDLEGILDMPSGVRPGSLFMVSPMSDTYRDGDWTMEVDGKTYHPLDPSDLSLPSDELADLPAWNLFFFYPGDAQPNSRALFAYRNFFLDKVVEARVPEWFAISDDEEICFPAGLEGCQETVIEGGELCVCGCFPNPLDVDLYLDNKPIPFPSAMSESVIRIPMTGIQPGPHDIKWISKGVGLDFDVVALKGSIAQDKLKLGQSTELQFELQGSTADFPLDISLDSGSVMIQGGNKQTAYFNSKNPNMIRRNVLATGIGKFNIGYSLELPPCPCAGYDEYDDDDDDFATHLMDAKGSADTTLLGANLPFNLNFSTDSLVVRTPRPPFDSLDELKFDFKQLGLRAFTADYGDMQFEQRANAPSSATVRNLRLGAHGGLAGGEAMLDLHTQFSTRFDPKSPLKVGAEYDFEVNDFNLSGNARDLGKISFQQSNDGPSTIHFSDLKRDAAGTTLYGNADFSIRGALKMNF